MNDYAGLVILPFLLSVAVYVWTAASLQAVFRKAGEEGWQAWVPVWNVIVLLRLAGLSAWWVLLVLVPFGVFVLLGVIGYRVGLAFGLDPMLTVVAVLVFPVWSSIVGWGSARWIGREEYVAGPVRGAANLDTRMAGRTPAPRASSAIPPRPLVAPEAAAGGAPYTPTFSPAPPLITSAVHHAAHTATPITSVPGAVADDDGDDDDLEVVELPRRRRQGNPPTWADTAADTPADTPADTDAEEAAFGGPRRAAGDPLPVDHGVAASVLPVPAPTRAAGRDPWAQPTEQPYARGAVRESNFFDTSAEVSAVASAPVLGTPLSARSSVSARRALPELPDAEAAFDETIIATRRRTEWMLTPPLGAPLAVTSDVLIIGRRPSSDPSFSDAQLVAISDETRTMSKTHARLVLGEDGWSIVDLDSTNGVVLLHDDGREVEVEAGSARPLTTRFLLGDAEIRLHRDPGERDGEPTHRAAFGGAGM